MLFRNILLALGLACLVSGVVLGIVWLDQMRRTAVEQKVAEPLKPAVLVATHAIPAGMLLRQSDVRWKEVEPGAIHSGEFARGRVSEGDFLGAVTRREFATGETLTAGDLVRAGDRQFLAAALKPGMRAVSMQVDASQSASGLALPGDYVDVILTQSFNEQVADLPRRSVGETVLHNVRVIAIDQTLNTAPPKAAVGSALISGEPRIPKTVTLELNERQAEALFVAVQLGKLNLAVRSLEQPSTTVGSRRTAGAASATWASDVSPALNQMRKVSQQSGSTIESTIRWAPGVVQ
jgi:pilus assembly protein CpaB